MSTTAPAPARAPFVHRRRIVWSDTDPAGIAYTGRLADFALEAIEAWCTDRLGTSWFGSHASGVIMPFVHMSIDFRSPLQPDEELLTEVRLERVGRTSVTTRVCGRTADEVVAFEGRFVQVFTTEERLTPMPVPARHHEALQRELAVAGVARVGDAAPAA